MKRIAAILLIIMFILGPAGRPLVGEDDNHHPAVPRPQVYPSAG